MPAAQLVGRMALDLGRVEIATTQEVVEAGFRSILGTSAAKARTVDKADSPQPPRPPSPDTGEVPQSDGHCHPQSRGR